MNRVAMAAAAFAAAWGAVPAGAATYTLNPVLDVSSLEPNRVYFNLALHDQSFAPITGLVAGDVITGNVSFSGSPFPYSILNYQTPQEQALLYFYGYPMSAVTYEAQFSFTGVSGNLNRNGFTTVGSNSFIAFGPANEDLTPDRFSFTGISFTVNILAASPGLNIVDAGFQTRAAGFGPNLSTLPVPEPATWAVMIFGFGLVGASLRRRERQLVGTSAARAGPDTAFVHFIADERGEVEVPVR